MNRYKLHKAGVDVNDALSRLDDDRELYDELLQTFKKENHLEKLEEAMAKKDAKEAFKEAHALKGETGNMGFTRLYEALSILVEKLRVEDLTDTEPMLEAVKSAYNELIEAIG